MAASQSRTVLPHAASEGAAVRAPGHTRYGIGVTKKCPIAAFGLIANKLTRRYVRMGRFDLFQHIAGQAVIVDVDVMRPRNPPRGCASRRAGCASFVNSRAAICGHSHRPGCFSSMASRAFDRLGGVSLYAKVESDHQIAVAKHRRRHDTCGELVPPHPLHRAFHSASGFHADRLTVLPAA